MKKASELAIEYWNKSPMERMHSTLQNYVYDYMNNQNERLRTQAIADAAEIARLQSGFDELKNTCESVLESTARDDYGRGIDSALRSVLRQINRITGDIEG